MRDDARDRDNELECALRDGLRTMSESFAGDPPSIGALTCLVEDVRRTERRREARELAQFLICAAAMIGGGLLLLTRNPAVYIALQAVLAVPAAVGAILLSGRRKQVTER